MSDIFFLFLFLAIAAAGSTGRAQLLAARRPFWSATRVVVPAALPIPGLLAGLLAFPAGHSVWTARMKPGKCGVDACGMVTGPSIIGLVIALLVCGLSILFARIVVRRGRR